MEHDYLLLWLQKEMENVGKRKKNMRKESKNKIKTQISFL